MLTLHLITFILQEREIEAIAKQCSQQYRTIATDLDLLILSHQLVFEDKKNLFACGFPQVVRHEKADKQRSARARGCRPIQVRIYYSLARPGILVSIFEMGRTLEHGRCRLRNGCTVTIKSYNKRDISRDSPTCSVMIMFGDQLCLYV